MKRKEHGFTLAELLIAAAIIGVLVSISIPVFSKQLQKARLAANQANARAAYAAAVAEFISNDDAAKLHEFQSASSSGKKFHVIYAYSTRTGTIVTEKDDYEVIYQSGEDDSCWYGGVYSLGKFTSRIAEDTENGTLVNASNFPDISQWKTNLAPFGFDEGGHGNLGKRVYPYWAVSLNEDGSICTWFASTSTKFQH